MWDIRILSLVGLFVGILVVAHHVDNLTQRVKALEHKLQSPTTYVRELCT